MHAVQIEKVIYLRHKGTVRETWKIWPLDDAEVRTVYMRCRSVSESNHVKGWRTYCCYGLQKDKNVGEQQKKQKEESGEGGMAQTCGAETVKVAFLYSLHILYSNTLTVHTHSMKRQPACLLQHLNFHTNSSSSGLLLWCGRYDRDDIHTSNQIKMWLDHFHYWNRVCLWNDRSDINITVRLHKCRRSSFAFQVALMQADRTDLPGNL